MSDEYRFNKEDTETVLNFLNVHFPDLATPENAVKVLKYMSGKAVEVESISAEEVQRLLHNMHEE